MGLKKPALRVPVKHALFTLKGLEYMAIDSAVRHGFSLLPLSRFMSGAKLTRRLKLCFPLYPKEVLYSCLWLLIRLVKNLPG